MVDYLTRADWDARPPRPGPGRLTVSRVEGAVIHWPGMGDRRLSSQASVAAALRGWQDYHMAPEPKGHGWSDIAYQVAVDQAGRAWDLRGLRTQSGANGDADVNERYGAILLVLGSGEHPTPSMIATTRSVVDDFRALYPHGTAIKPHSAVRPEPTDCPGDLVRALITHGAFDPGSPIDIPTDLEDDMWTPEQAEKIEKRYTLAHQLWLAQTAAERAVSDAYAAQLLVNGVLPADAIKKVEKLWTGVQRTQADALKKLT